MFPCKNVYTIKTDSSILGYFFCGLFADVDIFLLRKIFVCIYFVSFMCGVCLIKFNKAKKK